MSVPRLALILTAALALAAGPARAQYTEPYQPTSSGSLSGGLAATSFTFASDSTRAPFALAADGLGGRLAGEAASLTVTYATDEGSGAAWAAGVDLMAGGTVRLGVPAGGVDAALLIPIRFTGGFQYLAPAETGAGGARPDAYRIARVGLGAGLGAEVRADLGQALFPEVVGRASLLLAPGLLTHVKDEPFEDAFPQRTAVLDVEVRANRLGGGGVGIVAGYTRTTVRQRAERLAGASGVLDAVRADGFTQQSRIGLLRIGITF